MQDTFRLTLLAIILSILCLVFIILLATTLRRVFHSWKYKELDKQRKDFREKLQRDLDSGKVFQRINDYRSSSRSIKFQAIEDVLVGLINEERYRKEAQEILVKLGYITFYEKRLKSRNIITKSSAINKIGRMMSESSIDKLTDILKTKNIEAISVALRSLSKIGLIGGLKGILEHMPYLFKESLVAQKTVETSLTNFGAQAIPMLIEYGKKFIDPRITATLLEVISTLPLTKMSCSFAQDNLKSNEAEVRAKAVKVLGQASISYQEFDPGILLPLLRDHVWFVRLQAAKALGNLRYQKALDILGTLIIDENWQVRNAVSLSLTKFGDASIDIFLKALKFKDIYAKESICEEIEKTNFVYRLIQNLDSADRELFEKSKEVLSIMHSLQFSTPLIEYLKKGENDLIKREIALMITPKGQEI